LNKNRNFGQKSRFWPKIEILDKNRDFGQKSKLSPKKIKLCPTIEISENRQLKNIFLNKILTKN